MSTLYRSSASGPRFEPFKIILLLFAGLVIWSAFTQVAYAQTTQDLPTLEQIRDAAGAVRDGISSDGGKSGADGSRKILFGMLGEFGNSPLTSTGNADHLMGMLFFVFNSVLFVVGVSFIVYKMLMAVAESAHEGEVLGKRMNGLWIPIRFGTGVFGMLPVFKGFSLAQAIMMSIAILGIGLANMMVTTAIEANDTFNSVVPAPGLAKAPHATSIDSNIANAVFLMNVCAEATRGYKIGQSETDAQQLRVVQKTGREGDGLKVAGSGINCGGITLTFDPSILRGESTSGFRNPAVQYEKIKQFAEVTHRERLNSLLNLNTQVAPLAREWYSKIQNDDVQPYPMDKLGEISLKIMEDEKNNVRQNIATLSGGALTAVTEEAKENMKAGGWTSLASWYSLFAESNAAMQSAAMASQISIDPADFTSRQIPESVRKPLMTLMIQQNKSLDSCNVIGAVNEIGVCTFGQKVAREWIVEFLLGDTGGKGMINPITAAKNIGDWLLVGVGSVLTVSIGSDIVTMVGPGGLVSKVTSALKSTVTSGWTSSFFERLAKTNIATYGGRLASLVFLSAMVIGLVYAVYIPFVPFLTWFSALVSYFASVIEGLVAAQVWAFSHLNSDGEGMGHKTEKGYIYILNMLLRPGLMVFGFFFASSILTHMGTFFVHQFGPALANVQGNTWTGPFILIGVLGVVMIALITMIQTIFNLIYEVPDRVIAWFGHGADARMAKEMDGNIERKTGSMAHWGGNQALATMVGAKGGG